MPSTLKEECARPPISSHINFSPRGCFHFSPIKSEDKGYNRLGKKRADTFLNFFTWTSQKEDQLTWQAKTEHSLGYTLIMKKITVLTVNTCVVGPFYLWDLCYLVTGPEPFSPDDAIISHLSSGFFAHTQPPPQAEKNQTMPVNSNMLGKICSLLCLWHPFPSYQ